MAAAQRQAGAPGVHVLRGHRAVRAADRQAGGAGGLVQPLEELHQALDAQRRVRTELRRFPDQHGVARRLQLRGQRGQRRGRQGLGRRGGLPGHQQVQPHERVGQLPRRIQVDDLRGRGPAVEHPLQQPRRPCQHSAPNHHDQVGVFAHFGQRGGVAATVLLHAQGLAERLAGRGIAERARRLGQRGQRAGASDIGAPAADQWLAAAGQALRCRRERRLQRGGLAVDARCRARGAHRPPTRLQARLGEGAAGRTRRPVIAQQRAEGTGPDRARIKAHADRKGNRHATPTGPRQPLPRSGPATECGVSAASCPLEQAGTPWRAWHET